MNALNETVGTRMQEMGLQFMAASLESYLEEQSHSDKTLLQSLADLLELEYFPRGFPIHRLLWTRAQSSGGRSLGN